MWGGVGKSGWPMPRLMMSRPWFASSVARASTAKAFSSPMREKAGRTDSMAILIRCAASLVLFKAKGLSGNKSLIWRSWREGVVPLAVELIAGDVKSSHLGIGHRHALGIAVRVKFAPHTQASPGGGCADQVHDDTVAHQRRGAPVLADEREQPVLDRVPLRGAGRQMMDRDGQTALISQPLPLPLPQPHPHAVRAAPIGRDGQALGSRVTRSPDRLPPAPDGLPRKGCRVMVLAHPDPAGMGGQIINAIRHRPPQLLDEEVVHPHRFGRSLGTPRPPRGYA